MNYEREIDAATAQDEAFAQAARLRALRNPPGGCPWCDGSLDGYSEIHSIEILFTLVEQRVPIYKQDPQHILRPRALFSRCHYCEHCKQKGVHEDKYVVASEDEIHNWDESVAY